MTNQPTGRLEDIPLNDIFVDNAFNCRGGALTAPEIYTLAKSIEKQGLLQPVIVRPCTESDKVGAKGAPYKLLIGFRRRLAHKALYRESIPCLIRTDLDDDKTALILNFQENFERKNLTFMEEARTLKRLKDLGLTYTQLEKLLNKVRGWLQPRLLALELPEDIQVEIDNGLITQNDIKAIAGEVKKNGLSQGYALVRKIKEDSLRGRKTYARPPAAKKLNKKRRRDKGEMTKMIELIGVQIGYGLPTRLLAWVGGEVDTAVIFKCIRDIRPDAELPEEF